MNPQKKLRKSIMKIMTDSKTPEEPKNPDESTIFAIYKIFASSDEIQAFRQRFLDGGMGYGDAKQTLFEKLDAFLEKPREIYHELMTNPRQLDEKNATRARLIAKQTFSRTSQAMLGASRVVD